MSYITNESDLKLLIDTYKGMKSKRDFTKIQRLFEKKYPGFTRTLIDAPLMDFFPTPLECLDHDQIRRIIKMANHILEPSAGFGSIMYSIYKEDPTIQLTAFEYNKDFSIFLKDHYPKATIYNEDFLENKRDLSTVDTIICNPPFTHGSDKKYYINFYFKCLDIMYKANINGYTNMIFICPFGGLEKTQRKFMKDGDVIDTYGIFELMSYNKIVEICDMLEIKKPTQKEYKMFKTDEGIGESISYLYDLIPPQVSFISKCKFKTTGFEVGIYMVLGYLNKKTLELERKPKKPKPNQKLNVSMKDIKKLQSDYPEEDIDSKEYIKKMQEEMKPKPKPKPEDKKYDREYQEKSDYQEYNNVIQPDQKEYLFGVYTMNAFDNVYGINRIVKDIDGTHISYPDYIKTMTDYLKIPGKIKFIKKTVDKLIREYKHKYNPFRTPADIIKRYNIINFLAKDMVKNIPDKSGLVYYGSLILLYNKLIFDYGYELDPIGSMYDGNLSPYRIFVISGNYLIDRKQVENTEKKWDPPYNQDQIISKRSGAKYLVLSKQNPKAKKINKSELVQMIRRAQDEDAKYIDYTPPKMKSLKKKKQIDRLELEQMIKRAKKDDAKYIDYTPPKLPKKKPKKIDNGNITFSEFLKIIPKVRNNTDDDGNPITHTQSVSKLWFKSRDSKDELNKKLIARIFTLKGLLRSFDHRTYDKDGKRQTIRIIPTDDLELKRYNYANDELKRLYEFMKNKPTITNIKPPKKEKKPKTFNISDDLINMINKGFEDANESELGLSRDLIVSSKKINDDIIIHVKNILVDDDELIDVITLNKTDYGYDVSLEQLQNISGQMLLQEYDRFVIYN